MTTQEIMDHIIEMIPTKIGKIKICRSISIEDRCSELEIIIIFKSKSGRTDIAMSYISDRDDKEYCFDRLFDDLMAQYNNLKKEFKVKKDD